MKLSEHLYHTLVEQMSSSETLVESDLVLDKPSLVRYIKYRIMDYIESEPDIDRLSALLTHAVKSTVRQHGKKFIVSPQAVTEAIIRELEHHG